MTPMVKATAGHFELLAECYVPECHRPATVETSGGPMCDVCCALMQRAVEYCNHCDKAVYHMGMSVEAANDYARTQMVGWRPGKYGHDVEHALSEKDKQ
jgi:hypothetical protein